MQVKKNLTFFLTRWEMSETAAVEVLPLEVDVLLICLEVKYHTSFTILLGLSLFHKVCHENL